MGQQISRETLMDWRIDALARGGVPKPGDADPYIRYLANRLVAVIDALADAHESNQTGGESHG